LIKLFAKNGLKCFYTNADQLKNKMQELETRLRNRLPHIIGITEVKPKNSKYVMSPSEFILDQVSDYNLFSTNINNSVGRGMLMYIHKSIPASEVKMCTKFEENIFIQIDLSKNEKLLVGLIYRSDSGTEENNTRLCQLISEAKSKNHTHCMLMGDFYNYPHIDWESWNTRGDSVNTDDYKLVNCLQDNFLYQIVDQPTRWRGTNRPSILDLIITNEERMIGDVDYESPLGKSDHAVISFTIRCQASVNSSSKTVRCCDMADYNSIRQQLDQTCWGSLLCSEKSVDCNWELFCTELKDLEEKFIPTKNIKIGNTKRTQFPLDK
jgi:hypothetical protein